MKEKTFAESNFRYKKGERTHERNKLFNTTTFKPQQRRQPWNSHISTTNKTAR